MTRANALAFPLPLSADDFCRHALAAYYRACGEATPPRDYPLPDQWSDPATFVDTALRFFELRVHAAAHAAGVPGCDRAAEILAGWEAQPTSAKQHVSEVDPALWALVREGCRGVVPALKGQGRPALGCAGSAPSGGIGAGDAAGIPCASQPLLEGRSAGSIVEAPD